MDGDTTRSAAPSAVAALPQRVRALEQVLDVALTPRGVAVHDGLAALDHAAQEEWVPRNGARVVARAWVDPAFRSRLLADGRAGVGELGLPMPPHHRHLVVLPNTADVHNVICCTLCSCTAFTLIGLPPDWYKDLDYRARIVREARTVLAEMGVDLPASVQVRVWDTTADTRYLVLPERPAGSDGWAEDRLAGLVTRDGLIGAARL
jgi:nitrile hydratase